MAEQQSAQAPAAPTAEQPQDPATAAAPTVVVDTTSEEDSTYDEDEVRSYATSLSSSVEKYKWEHGRRYHSYREGAYNFPNDESEQDRLDLSHHLCLMLLDDKLHLADLPQDKPLRILDVGTGTGIWAMDIGDKYPNAEVVGNDLSPIQPRWVPPNVHFEVDDVEDTWPPRAPFDLIHIRYMLGSIQDWPKLLRQAWDQVAPGGWIELQDFNTHAYSEDGSEGEDNMVIKFCQVFNQACDKMGRNGSPGQHLKGWAEAAGFTNVQHQIRKVPIGPWAKDKKLKQIGALYQINLTELLEAALLGLMTRVEGWSPDEVHVFMAKVRTDLKKKSVHLMQEFHVVWAQKPAAPTSS
ncbi:S-adenosyl-L-methionine-dependent methyltransferase [Lentithecium fluviatile CBS 122367]|uniref:S-adenosyl-L-methionine-dependent methyltransferase n=1 Tax=Lentithecium fluviatile CBS 122367 TaxID=1168545 RepID=A0A6G1JLP3_9PLEO|nr:S-adenosyl-L-methionine-dependent methyltransferase [Lentithecium fluviatile CBS 122367]